MSTVWGLTRWVWGYLYWGVVWLLLGFFLAEMLGWSGIAPWPTLTATTRHAELYPLVSVALMGVIIFLPTHLLFGKPVWSSLLFGVAVSLLAHLVNHSWP